VDLSYRPCVVAPPVLDRLTAKESVRRFLRQAQRSVTGGGLSAVTVANYRRDLEEFLNILGEDVVLDEVTAEDLDDCFVTYASRPDGRFRRATKQPANPGEPVVGRGPGATARFRQSVARLFSVAERRGWISMNPMPDTTVKPKTKGLANSARLAPSEETARALLAQPRAQEARDAQAVRLAERDTAILALLFEVGLRVGELCALNRSDLSERDGTPWLHIRRGKGGKTRHVPLSPSTSGLLQAWMAKPVPRLPRTASAAQRADAAAAMFTTSRGKRIQPRSVQYLFSRHAAALPEHLRRHITPHAARHSAATLLLASGAADVRTVQAILGHSSLATTGIYLDVASDALERAVAAHPLTGAATNR